MKEIRFEAIEVDAWFQNRVILPHVPPELSYPQSQRDVQFLGSCEGRTVYDSTEQANQDWGQCTQPSSLG